MVSITICGGGSLSHALAAVIGADPDNEVSVLTRQPHRWSPQVLGIYLDIAQVVGRIAAVSSNAADVIPGADVVLICVPSFAREKMLRDIGAFLSVDAIVGCLPGYGGFEFQARAILGVDRILFGTQRVPYVRKTVSYGQAVWISGIRPRLVLGALPYKEAPRLATLLHSLLNIPTDPVPSYLPVTLSASNPIFHPARLYAAFAGGAPLHAIRPQLFYEEWDDAASHWYLRLDDDVQAICRSVTIDMSAAQPIRKHFGISTESELTARIRGLSSLRDRWLPLRDVDGRYLPDTHTSYFTEDLPFGLAIIKGVADIAGVPTPAIDTVLRWSEHATGACYFAGEDFAGQGVADLPVPRNFGINDIGALIARGAV